MKVYQKQLVIDTATKWLYIGLFEGSSVIEEVYLQGDNDHSATCMNQISNIFLKHGLKANQLDRIIVGIGPGSYTGIRVAVVVAKILAWSLNIPIYTVSSLALIASSSAKTGKLLALIDARRGFYFYGGYHCNKNLSLIASDQYGLKEEINTSFIDYIEVYEGKPNLDLIFNSELLKRVEDVHLLTPVYLRKTEAETNLDQS